MRSVGLAIIAVVITAAALLWWLNQDEAPAPVMLDQAVTLPAQVVHQPDEQRAQQAPPVQLAQATQRQRQGRVLDINGTPLDTALIIRGDVMSFSDEEGRFDLLLEGAPLMKVSHPCCVTARVFASELNEPGEITLQPRVVNAPFSGEVVDEDGRAVAGAAVSGVAVSPHRRVPQRFSVITDESGHFSQDVARDASVELVAKLGDKASATRTVPASEEAHLILLAREGSISGQVTGPEGEAVTWFKLTLDSKDFHLERRFTPSDGRYELTGLPRLNSAVATVTGFGLLDAQQSLTLSRAEGKRDVDFQLPAGRSFYGIVFDMDAGGPLALATVTVQGAASSFPGDNGKAVTDERGQFVLRGLPLSPIEICTTLKGYGPVVRVVEVGDEGPVVIPLMPDADEVEAQDEENEAASVGIRITSTRVPPPGAGYRVAKVNSEGGAAAAGIVEADEIVAVGNVAASSVKASAFFRLLNGSDRSLVTMTVQRGGTPFRVQVMRTRLPPW